MQADHYDTFAESYARENDNDLLPPDLGERKSFLCFLFFVLEAA